MHSTTQLNDNYEVKEVINLQTNQKLMLLVNGLATLIMVVFFFLGNWISPFFDAIDRGVENPKLLMLKAGVTLVGYFIYIILHEFTHGYTMKHFGAQHVQYGFTGIYAFAGSKDDYFDKYAFLRISLAPVVLWGIIFLVLQLLIPGWGWVFYLLQIGNLSGAAGDMYVSCHLLPMPNSIYINDTGVEMTIYDLKK